MEYYTHENINKMFDSMLDDISYIKRNYIIRKNNKDIEK